MSSSGSNLGCGPSSGHGSDPGSGPESDPAVAEVKSDFSQKQFVLCAFKTTACGGSGSKQGPEVLSFPYVGSPGGQSSACGVSRLFPFLCT